MRTNTINLIIGDRGTGKTTFIQGDEDLGIKGVLPVYERHSSIKKCLVVDTFDNPVWRHVETIDLIKLSQWKRGIRRLFGSDTSLLISAIEQRVYNTAVVFEDATKFIKRFLPKDVEIFLIDTKQKNVDVYFLYHYLMAPPTDLIRIADTLTLFKTGDTFDNAMYSKYSRNPYIKKLFEEVQASKNPYYYKTIKLGA